jgi:type I restriction enzyme S subunit
MTTDGLPQGWVWATVGELGEVRLGRQRAPKHQGGNFPTKYLRAANITWNGLDLSDVLEMNFRPEEQRTYRLEPGDVLLSEASGSADEVGKPAVWRGEIANCCFQNTVIRFRPKHTSSEYAQLLFTHYARSGVFTEASKGIGIHHLSADRFSRLRFPLPPLTEQQRIVAKVEELFSDLDAGVAALERARANLKKYRAAVLKAAVEGRLTADWRATHPATEPASDLLARILADRRKKWEADQLAKFVAAGKSPPKNWQAKYAEPAAPDTSNLPPLPAGWCWARLSQVASFQNGRAFPSAEYAEEGVKLLRPGNLYEAGPVGWNAKNTRRLPEKWATDFTDYLVGEYELVMNLTAQSLKDEFLGRTCVTAAGERCLLNQRIARITPLHGFDPKYALLLLKSALFRRFVNQLNTGSLIQHMFTSQLDDFAFPLPQLAEQERIVAEVEARLSEVAAAERQIDANLTRAARLRQAILKRAFAGRLVPQDPNDEPAVALLERLKMNRDPKKAK